MKHQSAEAKSLGFYIHALVFVVAIVVQMAINVWVGPPYWVMWVLPAWAIGVLAHWWFVVGPGARHKRLG